MNKFIFPVVTLIITLVIINFVAAGWARPVLDFPMGEVSITNNSVVTDISAANAWKVINATWDSNPDNMDFQTFSNGTLRYTGGDTKFFHVAMTLSVKGTGNNDFMRAAIFKNSVLLPGGQIQQKLGAANDVGSTAIHVATTLSPNDFLNVYILNENDADDFVVTYANLFAMGMKMD